MGVLTEGGRSNLERTPMVRTTSRQTDRQGHREVFNSHPNEGRRQIKWYFWVLPTTKCPPPLAVVKEPLFCGKSFICLESPDTEK